MFFVFASMVSGEIRILFWHGRRVKPRESWGIASVFKVMFCLLAHSP